MAEYVKVVAKIIFTIFLAVTAYENTMAFWQQALTIVAATVLVVFFISDMRTSRSRGHSSVG